MASYFEQYLNRQKPNRAERRKKQQERARRARRATRQWQRTKGDEDGAQG